MVGILSASAALTHLLPLSVTCALAGDIDHWHSPNPVMWPARGDQSIRSARAAGSAPTLYTVRDLLPLGEAG